MEEYLLQNENKTLEFKKSVSSCEDILKTIGAFANTSGGTIIIGVKDRTREIVGVDHALQEEMRLLHAISDSLLPRIIPDIGITTYRDRELILVRVPHIPGPFYLKAEGPEKGVYIRLGSTNRVADKEMLQSLTLLRENSSYDELPAPQGIIDEDAIEKAFATVKKRPTNKQLEAFGIFTNHFGQITPKIGGVLLFGQNRGSFFPDAIIRCARFKGVTKEKMIDQQEITGYLPLAIPDVLQFIERNTPLEGVIGKIQRQDIPAYPYAALREACINAILHADYTIKGSCIQIAVFEDRIEFTNPGGLPFGQTMAKALLGCSKRRNRVIGRVFQERGLAEQWGIGLPNILAAYKKEGLKAPLIEEYNTHFRVTLYARSVEKMEREKRQGRLEEWKELLIQYLGEKPFITTKEAAAIWQVSRRTAQMRLKKLAEVTLLRRIATAKNDPLAKYAIPQ